MPLQSKRPQQLAHIPELDGIRGIAALMVLCHHLFFTSIPHPERWNWFVVVASSLGHAGGNGVDLFFVLSGFLITSLLLLDRGGPHFYANFYWKRALRIFPLYLVALACLAALSPGSRSYALLSLLFLANFAQAFHVASSGPFWTLAIEEQFYLLWPRFANSFSVAKLQRFALALVIASPALRLVAAAFGHHNYEFTFFHCDGLALGAVLACQQIRWPTSDRQAHPRTRRWLHPSFLLLIAVLLIALPSALAFYFNPESKVIFAAEALQLSGISLLSYSLITAAVHRSGSSWLAVFRSRTLTFFGLISYCLYIANGYVVILYDRLRGPTEIGNMGQYAVRPAIVLLTTVLICILSRYVIELPAMSLRRHVLPRS